MDQCTDLKSTSYFTYIGIKLIEYIDIWESDLQNKHKMTEDYVNSMLALKKMFVYIFKAVDLEDILEFMEEKKDILQIIKDILRTSAKMPIGMAVMNGIRYLIWSCDIRNVDTDTFKNLQGEEIDAEELGKTLESFVNSWNIVLKIEEETNMLIKNAILD